MLFMCTDMLTPPPSLLTVSRYWPCSACLQVDDDIVLQRDNGPSPSRATEEAMWGKITRLDEDLDGAIQKYLDVSTLVEALQTSH